MDTKVIIVGGNGRDQVEMPGSGIQILNAWLSKVHSYTSVNINGEGAVNEGRYY